MTEKTLKTCAVINDLSGFGRCALTVSLPVLSALGVRACPVPTAVLSNHTGFDEYYFYDFTEHMKPYLEGWEKLGLEFDGIYTGFLGSERQVDVISEFLDRFKTEKTRLFVDPVMGDHGRLYSTYTPSLVERMKSLAVRADVVTPNLTELALLCGRDYSEVENADDRRLFAMAESICRAGAGAVVITGVRRGRVLKNLCYDGRGGAKAVASSRYIDGEYCGTGDLFASLLCGHMLKGSSLPCAVKRAAKFLKLAMESSKRLGVSPLDGVAFELVLHKHI